jgi:hypothetical protein
LRPYTTITDLKNKHTVTMSTTKTIVVVVDPIEHIPKELNFEPTNINSLIASKFPCQPLNNKTNFAINFNYKHAPTTLYPNFMLGPQEISPGHIALASEHMLPPRQQSRLMTELASHDQPGSPSQLGVKITKKEFQSCIAGDGNVEARFRLSRVVRELSSSKVPVKLDSLVMVVGQVEGFGAWFVSKERKG